MILPLRVKHVAQIGVEGGVSDCAFGVNRLWIQPPLDQSDVTRDLWTVFASLAVSHSILDFQAQVPILRYESAWLLKVGERGREVRSVLKECSVRADLQAGRGVAGRCVPSW